jgi:hypothetical protein
MAYLLLLSTHTLAWVNRRQAVTEGELGTRANVCVIRQPKITEETM